MPVTRSLVPATHRTGRVRYGLLSSVVGLLSKPKTMMILTESVIPLFTFVVALVSSKIATPIKFALSSFHPQCTPQRVLRACVRIYSYPSFSMFMF